MSDITPQDPVILGRINGIYGVKGWVKVFSFTEIRDDILSYGPWLLGKNNQWRSVKVLNGRIQGKGLVAHIEGVDDRDAARDLMGWQVAIERTLMPALPPGEYYWSDLIGCQVENLDGFAFGEVSNLLETGAHDVMVVQGERERLVPFVQQEFIKQVDVNQQRIVVDWDPDF